MRRLRFCWLTAPGLQKIFGFVLSALDAARPWSVAAFVYSNDPIFIHFAAHTVKTAIVHTIFFFFEARWENVNHRRDNVSFAPLFYTVGGGRALMQQITTISIESV